MEEFGVDDEQLFDDEHESTQYRACYIFRSSRTRSIEQPRKKRKLSNVNGILTTSSDLSKETASQRALQRRQRLFHDFWGQKNAQFEAFTGGLDKNTLDDLIKFVNTPTLSTENDRLPTALLLTGVESTIHEQVINDLGRAVQLSGVVADLHSRQCPNLQSSLKAIIKTVITEHSGLDAYENHLSKHKRLIPLNFDLELLELFANDHSIGTIAISFREIERFDGQLLNELIDTLHAWQKRVPFVLLLEVTSTVELLEFRLSKACLSTIDTQKFDFGMVDDFRFPLLVQMQSEVNDGPRILLGPNLVNTLFDLTQDQGKTIQSFTRTLEHSCMSHFYTNTLSILANAHAEVDTSDLSEAIRHTESFRQYCEDLLEKSDRTSIEKVRRFLNDDEFLVEEARIKIAQGQQAYTETCRIIEACSDFYYCVSQVFTDLHLSKIEVALDLYQSVNNLLNSDTFVTLETFLNSTTVSCLNRICSNLQPSTYTMLVSNETREMLEQEAQREDSNAANGTGIHINGASAHSSSTHQRRTKTSKNSPRSKSEASKDMLIEALRDRLKSASLDLSELFLHEAYILSSRAIKSKQVSESNPRTAVERALLMPGDYLGCECITQSQQNYYENEAIDRHSSQHGRPPTASIVFTLLQEAPININLRDLFDAFASRCEQDLSTPIEIQSSEEADSETVKALLAHFYRALAELRLGGLIKTSAGTQIKKKVAGKSAKLSSHEIDYVAKTSWVGM